MEKVIALKKDGIRYNLCKACTMVESFISDDNETYIQGVQWAIENDYTPVYLVEIDGHNYEVSGAPIRHTFKSVSEEVVEAHTSDDTFDLKKRKAYRNRKIVALITIAASFLFLIGMKEVIFEHPKLFVPLMGVWAMYSGLVFILAFEKFECDPKFIKLEDRK